MPVNLLLPKQKKTLRFDSGQFKRTTGIKIQNENDDLGELETGMKSQCRDPGLFLSGLN